MGNSVILQGGLVADGGGSVPTHGDVLIQDGVIRAILPEGTETRDNHEIVDCRGLIVAPGFVDIHCHSDLSLFAYPENESRVTQGITTEVVGNCGMTPAPSAGDNPGLASVIGTIDVVPEVEWQWDDFAGWMSALDRLSTTTNVAAHVGHGSARFAVAGPLARPLAPEDLRTLVFQLEAALDAGAVGASLGLMYAPGEGADIDELVHVGHVVARYGGVLSVHMRDYSAPGLLGSAREVAEIALRSGARTEISHLRQVGKGSFSEVLDFIEEARVSADIAADAYPYVAGHTNLLQLFPSDIRMNGATAVSEYCRSDPAAAAAGLAASGHAPEAITVMKARTAPETVGRVAADLGEDPWPALVNLIVENDGLVDVAVVGLEWADIDEGYQRPWLSVASDGTALNSRHEQSMPHPRSWGAFPAAYRRLRAAGHPIGESIRRLTDAPAKRAGLTARLVAGHRADITVIDDATLDSTATYARPTGRAVGVHHVYVAGRSVYCDGIITEARPGQLIRGGNRA